MQQPSQHPSRRVHLVLHAVFALTGIAHVIGGPLLPSIAAGLHLNDSQSGMAFFVYFAGSAVGALLCRGNYARTMTFGFIAMAVGSACVSIASPPVFPLALFVFGISVGVPMSAVSLFVGRNFRDRCAPILTALNFTWSLGALLAPLLAARILVHHTYKAAYVLLSVAALAAAGCTAWAVKDSPEIKTIPREEKRHAAQRILVFSIIAAFLQVGIENTASTWLSTYALRTVERGAALAAAVTALYWTGFLASRGVSSLLLVRKAPEHVFRAAVGIALFGAVLLVVSRSAIAASMGMLLLGIGLAPIYPLVIAEFFARARRTSDSRWILAIAGFGGSALPWIAGTISSGTQSIRLGILTIPVALLLMIIAVERLGAEKDTLREKISV